MPHARAAAAAGVYALRVFWFYFVLYFLLLPSFIVACTWRIKGCDDFAVLRFVVWSRSHVRLLMVAVAARYGKTSTRAELTDRARVVFLLS